MKDNKYLMTFKKTYTFEGTEYTEIDLSAIQDLKASDLIAADKLFATRGQMSAMNEMSVGYTCIIASQATQKPLEFFENIPANEAIKLKNMVARFFYS
ncbi:MAG: hypothetical protein ACI8WT_000008 [Clostridium sp.]|jgi:hypothetical protein